MGISSNYKLSHGEVELVRSTLDQLCDTVNIVNATVNPPVFFKRLNLTFDLLLLLQEYEKYKIYKSGGPSKDLKKLKKGLGLTVDNFIDRFISDSNRRIFALKGESSKRKAYEKSIIELISAFDCAHTFWSGNDSHSRVLPHYTGPLFTRKNYKRVMELYYSLDDCD